MLRTGRSAAKRDEPIAIVGASCRFPGADGLERFWQLLTAGTDAVGEVDAERWATRFFYHPNRGEAGKSYTWAAGLIDGIDRFEPAFFGMSPREAAQVDPQQRILLELVWHAFEDAGIPPSRARGSEAGVYIGASSTDYSDLRLGDPAGGDSYFMTGNALSILANRISYVFDLHGPSLVVDTACSSSLVALHQACEAIRAGRIPCAVVGGVNLLLTPYPFLGFSAASMLSRRGRCFAFDERADGYVRGEGAGVVIIKPLAAALADRDPIRAVIVATGSNSDGRTIGVSLPSEASQSALLRSLYQTADVAVDDIAFFEMHGTGTPAGDPIEAAAVGRTLGSCRRELLPIGSVKTNIGHLEPASGMAGLLKAALALDHGVVPASLHCETPSPRIDFAALGLRLARTSEPIAVAPERRLAGVNSFGFGGTNAHVVLAAPPLPEAAATAEPAVLPPLAISAVTEVSLRALAGDWRARLAAAPDERVTGMLRAAGRARDHHRHRLAVLGPDRSAVVASLDRFFDGASEPGTATGISVGEGKLAFAFAGNGAQFPGMGRAALRANATFRVSVEAVDAVFYPELGWSVVERIDRGLDAATLERTDIAQPVLFAIQVGIVGALRAAGITAQGHIGHSVGEIAAAWAAGALSLADAARVVAARSRSQQRTQGTGRMAALALGADAARDFLGEAGSRAEIAALNAAHSVTVAGTGAEIDRLVGEARRRDLWCRRLDLDFAFHSPLMEPVRDELLASLAGLSSRPPTARLVSTVTGAAVEDDRLDAEHWWRNVRHPVRFADGTATLIAEGYRIFVEIGPSSILHSYLADALRVADAEGRVLASLRRDDGDADPFRAVAAQCYVAGCDLPSAPVFSGEADPRGLPLYPWARQRLWFDQTVEAVELQSPPFDHPLLGFRQSGPPPYWRNHLDAHVLPWIADHAVEGVQLYPAAAMIETALAAARWRWPDAAVLEVTDLEVRRPLPFDPGRMRELRTALVSDDGDWELASRPRLSSEPMTTHAVGHVGAAGAMSALPPWPEAPATTRIDADTVYRRARDAGLDYGARFRTVHCVELAADTRAVVHLDPEAIGEPLDGYLLHPALLDGALQGLLALLAADGRGGPAAGFLPWRFGRVRVAAPFGRASRTARLELTRVGARSAAANLALYDEAGDAVAELTDCWFRGVELGRRGSAAERLFRVDLVPAPLAEGDPPAALLHAGATVARLAGLRTPDPERGEEALLLDALLGAVALQVLGRLVAPHQAFSIRELVERELMAPASGGIAECLLRALEGVGGAAESQGVWRVETPADLPDIADIWRLLLADAPDLVGELALVGAALDNLPGLVAAGPGPGPAASPAMVEHLLKASPASADGLDLLRDALRMIADDWPAVRPLRILEIGAGSGVTRVFLQCLGHSPAPVAYLATSPDREEADRLAAVARSFAGANACVWRPGATADALGDTRFDIVIAANACARLRSDAGTLATLRDLLVPGGLFLAVEPEPNALWDIAFGQSAEWWLADGSRGWRSPLRSGEDWRDELGSAGFADAGAASLGPGPWPCAVFWGSAPARGAPAEAAAAERHDIALVGDDTPLRGALSGLFEAAGHRVASIAAADDPDAPGIVAREDAAPQLVLFLCDGSMDETSAGRQLVALAETALRAAEWQAALWVVTCDAQQAAPGEPGTAALVGAGLWGLARVLANELPRLPLRLVDLASAAPAEMRARQIADEIGAATPETEIVWTPRGRHVMRLRLGLPPRHAEPADGLRLVRGVGGGFDALAWQRHPAQSPGAGEVEIEVRAAALNFRDVMWAMGLLPEEALIDGFAGAAFGLECAGVVRALGPGVEGLGVGERVMAFAPAALGTRVRTVADAVVAIPEGLGFAAAATLPVAFVTAVYALGRLAQVEPGERVLIHAAAGGVGLAAIQYAKHRGAIVVATAGSPVKRRFLQLAGADHVLDSRDLGFADAVREITLGEGVDVVLNSLSGEAMERSLEVLKPFGRFVELGKRDFYLNRRMHLRPLRQNISYFAIDVDQLPLRRPSLARSLLGEISALLGAGAIRPLAHRLFRYSEIGDAFRLMQSSGHIGKLVLTPDAEIDLPPHTVPEYQARRDGTYLVTGGVDGFGFAAARWLVEHGAGSVALLSRRGPETPGCAERVAELAAAGAEVGVYRGDVANRASLTAVLDEVRATRPPLRGIVHAAAAVDDRMTADLDAAGVDAVLRPKIEGALALDALTRDDPIELFILFSSATTLLGAPGQGAYVAANTVLEALARRRHAAGRPALAVAWGPIEDAGYLAQRPDTREALARRLGAKPMPAAQALASLSALLASGLPVAGCAEASWGDARRFLPVLATPLFAEVRSRADQSAGDEALADRLLELDPEAALGLLKGVVAEEAARILRLPAGGVDPGRPLSQLGMDSLMAVELRLALEARLRIDLPLVSLAEGTSIASIAARLAAALASGAAEAADVAAIAARHETLDAVAAEEGETEAGEDCAGARAAE